MQSWGSYSYAYGPLVAFAVIGVLALLLRWAFSRGGSLVPRPPHTTDESEYGLLCPVAAPDSAAEADSVVAQLDGAGIRTTVVTTRRGLRVMVWPDDEASARAVLGGSGGDAFRPR